MAQGKLTGRRILVAEDEYYLADDLRRALEKEGAAILGPFPTVGRALSAVDTETIDCAVLDLNLQGELSFGLWERLAERGVPALGVSGYDRSSLPAKFAEIPLFEKPVDMRKLIDAITTRLP